MDNKKSKLVLIAFLAEILLAGGNGVAIRFSNRELAPFWGAGIRFTIASILLLLAMRALNLKFPKGNNFQGAVLYGVLQFAGAFGFFYFALVQIQAGFGQTILALVPLATLLLAVAQGQERFRRDGLIGTALALTGLLIISLDPQRQAIPLIHLLAALASVICFAQALIVVRRLPSFNPISLNGIGMAAGAPVLLIGSIILGEPLTIPQQPATWWALAYVTLVGSVVVFLLHVFVAQSWKASRAAYVMVAIPLVTVILSSWLDNERITFGLVLGGIMILGGVYFGALRN